MSKHFLKNPYSNEEMVFQDGVLQESVLDQSIFETITPKNRPIYQILMMELNM